MMRRKQCCGMQRLILLLVVATWLAWFAVLSSTDQRRNRTPAPVRRTEQPMRVASDTISSRGTPKFLRFSPPNTVVDWGTFEPNSPWASWRLWSSTNPLVLRRNVRLNVQAKAIVLQFPNRSVFTSLVEDGLLVPSQRFGFDGKVFIGYRRWVQSNGDSHSTEACAHIALTTACAVGFRVLTFEEHNPHSLLCEIMFPVVNKDMPGDYNDSVSTSGVLSGFDQFYAPSAAEAELFLFLYGAALAEEEAYMVPRLDVLVAPAQQHVYLPTPSHQHVIEVAIDFVVSVGEARFTLLEKDAAPTAVAVENTANVSSCLHGHSAAILDVMFKSESGQRVVRTSINHRCRITLQFPTPPPHIVGLVQWKVSVTALEVTVTQWTAPFSLTLELDPPAIPAVDITCAALINPKTERCIRNIHAAFRLTEEEEEHSQPLPSFFHNQMVSLVPASEGFAVVDGHVTYLLMGGQQKQQQRVSSRVAHFQSLVLHFSDSSRNNASSFVALRLVAPFCAQCQEFIDRCPGAIVRFVVPIGGVPIVSFPVEESFQNDSALRNTTPILVSMSIHKSIPQFIAQLENIATYIGRARCVIIVHVSPLWRFTEMEWAALRSANASNRYPSVYINPHSYHLSFSMLFSVQLLNAKYVVDALPWVHFSHVLCVASNEVFLRKRVADFIQLYDVSTCSSNTKHDSIRSFHAYPGGEAINSFRAVKGDASEELGSRLWPGKLPPYGLRGSLKASMGPALKNVVVPIAQSFTEGSYFRKDVALALSNELQRLFPLEEAHLNKPISSKLESLVLDPATFSLDRLRYCFPNWYSWSEIVPGMLLQSLNQQKEEETETFGSPIWKRFAEQQHRQLKFGPRISSVVWNRPNWVATPRDVHWVRCSPFDISLFAMKRHVFDESNPFFRKIRDLQRSDDMIDTIRGVRRISDECYRSVPLTIGF